MRVLDLVDTHFISCGTRVGKEEQSVIALHDNAVGERVGTVHRLAHNLVGGGINGIQGAFRRDGIVAGHGGHEQVLSLGSPAHAVSAGNGERGQDVREKRESRRGRRRGRV
jgi:hypothetical protein